MDFDKAEEILEKITEAVDIEGMDEETLAAMIEDLYESLVQKYRPIVHAAPQVLGKVAQDLVPLVVSLADIANIIREDTNFQETQAKSRKFKAEQRFKSLMAYKDAGFTKPEAMKVLLLDIANEKSLGLGIVSVGETLSKVITEKS